MQSRAAVSSSASSSVLLLHLKVLLNGFEIICSVAAVGPKIGRDCILISVHFDF